MHIETLKMWVDIENKVARSCDVASSYILSIPIIIIENQNPPNRVSLHSCYVGIRVCIAGLKKPFLTGFLSKKTGPAYR